MNERINRRIVKKYKLEKEDISSMRYALHIIKLKNGSMS